MRAHAHTHIYYHKRTEPSPVPSLLWWQHPTHVEAVFRACKIYCLLCSALLSMPQQRDQERERRERDRKRGKERETAMARQKKKKNKKKEKHQMRWDDTVIVSMSKRVRYQMVAKKKTKRRQVEGVCLYVFVCASLGRCSVARTVNNFHENEWSQRGHRAECYSGK